MDIQKVKLESDRYIDDRLDELWDFSKFIHSNPELGFKEEIAAETQVKFLRENGFDVEEGIGGLPTAFRATYEKTKGDLTIAVVSEYDALPSIGHACGHNLICASALGTAVGLKKVIEDNNIPGKLVIMGTPAEESGGGKIILLEKNEWEGIDAILFMHPTSDTTKMAGECMSSMRIELEFIGKSAHAASHPASGVNALSAANLYFVATGLLRQHTKGDFRLSGIIEEGGKATELIPDLIKVKGTLSAFNLKELYEYVEKVKDCANGAALATGCEVNINITPGYQGRVPNEILSEICREELHDIGEPVMEGLVPDFGGEDLGNVSREIPICNPYVTIFPDYKISGHTEKFRDLAASENGKRCIQVTSKALTRTGMELFLNPSIVEEAKKELAVRMESN